MPEQVIQSRPSPRLLTLVTLVIAAADCLLASAISTGSQPSLARVFVSSAGLSHVQNLSGSASGPLVPAKPLAEVVTAHAHAVQVVASQLMRHEKGTGGVQSEVPSPGWKHSSTVGEIRITSERKATRHAHTRIIRRALQGSAAAGAAGGEGSSDAPGLKAVPRGTDPRSEEDDRNLSRREAVEGGGHAIRLLEEVDDEGAEEQDDSDVVMGLLMMSCALGMVAVVYGLQASETAQKELQLEQRRLQHQQQQPAARRSQAAASRQQQQQQ